MKQENIPLLHTVLDQIEQGKLNLNDSDWIVAYPTLSHKEKDLRWFWPVWDLKQQMILRRELKR